MKKTEVLEKIQNTLTPFASEFQSYYNLLSTNVKTFNFRDNYSSFAEALKDYFLNDNRHYFTISSKEQFSAYESKDDSFSFVYTPLNDHSRIYMHKGDIVFCYRQGQFGSLDDALDIRGIYAVGFVMSEPQILYPQETGHNKYGVMIFVPVAMQQHLELRNIQLNPYTINLTPYNGNRNDSLQYIPEKKHYETLLSMICKKNPEISSILETTRNEDIKQGILPTEKWRNICSSPINLTSSPLILYGPPGTGKTYKMQHDYIDKFAKEDRFITTFHQSFSYEEFVEGLKPVLADKPDGDTSSDVKYKIEKGIFYKACERAAELAGYESKKDESETPLQKCIADVDRSTKMDEAIKENKIVLLCIDEINRANVSVVFGDLISLIEPSKRIGAKNEMVVSLPYSKEDFAVPANLMIVGTMNTADRSIQLLDSALRRRFRFEELLPDYNEIKNSEKAKSILNAINARIRCLLDKDHQIGHSYFIEAKNDLDIFNALKDSVIPLLEEYFYNDAQKIRQILNENDNTDNAFYIKDEEAENASKYISTDYDDEKAFHQLNPKLSDVKDEDSATSFISHIAPKAD